MGKIGDEIRDFVARSYNDEYMDPKELLALADRIDAEMVALPKGADWKPILPDQTVYDLNGNEYEVENVTLYDDGGWLALATLEGATNSSVIIPTSLTHTQPAPDSLERIADELDEWRKDAVEDSRIRASDEGALHGFAERIKKLANERDDKQGDE